MIKTNYFSYYPSSHDLKPVIPSTNILSKIEGLRPFEASAQSHYYEQLWRHRAHHIKVENYPDLVTRIIIPSIVSKSIHIRPPLYDGEKDLSLEERDMINLFKKAFTVENLSEKMKDPRFLSLGVYNSNDNTLLAAALFQIQTVSNPKLCFLQEISVDPSARNDKLGTLLVGAIASIAKEQNCQILTIVSWANDFYVALGFVPSGDTREKWSARSAEQKQKFIEDNACEEFDLFLDNAGVALLREKMDTALVRSSAGLISLNDFIQDIGQD